MIDASNIKPRRFIRNAKINWFIPSNHTKKRVAFGRWNW